MKRIVKKPRRKAMNNKIKAAVEKHAQLILNAERYIWRNPETGYREVKTTAYLMEKYEELGYELTMAEGITGFYTTIDTGKPGPTLLILSELDSVICPSHPEADPVTGAVHSCGHHAQCAALLGVAAALKEEGMLDGLSGKIKLCAVPAEELLEIGFRSELREKGVIKYLGGKSEFAYRGYFDDVDLAFMVHTAKKYTSLLGSVGCIAKTVIYKGKAAHAGGSPWNGINAIYAATQGLTAVNAIRETFKDRDCIRFHPIITEGGAMVNAIPESAKIETYVRGMTFDAITDANKRINRALIGAALSLGANVEVLDLPGYAPLKNSTAMLDMAKAAYEDMFDGESFNIGHEFSTGSTDMGDLSAFMPVIHPYSGGAKGTSHGADYYIEDAYEACVKCAMWQIKMLRALLENGAELAKKIVSEYEAPFGSVKEFLEYQESIVSSGDRIVYTEDKAEVRL